MKLPGSFLDLIFPRVCYSCNSRLTQNSSIICSNCSQELVWLENVCPICANKLVNGKCSYCSENHWYFDKVFSLFAFSPVVQNLIHSLKYDELTRISIFFKPYLQKFLKENRFRELDLAVPVPIHSVRKRERGYNQAELISNLAAEILQIQHLPRLIKRKFYTRTQTRLSREERKRNVASAFSLQKKYNICGKNILLIDDVFTTGSTVNSISRLLKENGCGRVYVLTISHA